MDSLNSIWGAKNLPYQFSAAKYLILQRYQPGWKIGINVLSNIEQFYIAHPNISNKDLGAIRVQDGLIEKMRQMESHRTQLEVNIKKTNIEIESLEEANQSLTEEQKNNLLLRKKELLLNNSTYEIELLSTNIEDLTLFIEFLKKTSYGERSLAIEFLYIGQWDNLETVFSNDEDLKYEIMMAKNIMARNDPKRLSQVADEFLSLAKKLVSSNAENTQPKKTKEQLCKYDYLFISLNGTMSLESKISMAEEIKNETQSHTTVTQILRDFLSLTNKSSQYEEIKSKLSLCLLNNPFNLSTHFLLPQIIFNSFMNIEEAVQTAAS